MKRQKVIHIYIDFNGYFRIETNEDTVLKDGFDNSQEAYEYAKKMFTEYTVYQCDLNTLSHHMRR